MSICDQFTGLSRMMFGRKNAFSTLVFAKRIRSKSVAFFAGRSAVVAPWGVKFPVVKMPVRF